MAALNKVQAVLSPSTVKIFKAEKIRLESAVLQKVSDSFVLNAVLEEFAALRRESEAVKQKKSA